MTTTDESVAVSTDMVLQLLNPLEAVVVLIALIAGVWLWREWTSIASAKLNQSLFSRSAHRSGRDATSSALAFTSERSAAELGEALRRGLDVPDGVQTLLFERLYLAGQSARTLEFAFGSKLHTSFRSLLVLDDVPSGGSTGVYQVTAWEHSHGLVNDLDQLLDVQRRMLAVLDELDAAVAVVAPEPVRGAAGARRMRRPARPHGRRVAPAALRVRGARS